MGGEVEVAGTGQVSWSTSRGDVEVDAGVRMVPPKLIIGQFIKSQYLHCKKESTDVYFVDYTVKSDNKATKGNYRAVGYLQILIIKYEELLHDRRSWV